MVVIGRRGVWGGPTAAMDREEASVGEELLRPSEAAARLGMAANTLRVYSTRFAALLSPPAARPTAGRAGRPGHRLYSPEDVALLERARDLVAGGLTYEEALARLRSGLAPTDPARLAAGLLSSPPELAAHLTTLRQAVDAWRALAEERAREAAELRARLETARAELDEERRRRLAAEELVRLGAGEPKGGESARSRIQSSWISRLLSGDAEGRTGPR